MRQLLRFAVLIALVACGGAATKGSSRPKTPGEEYLAGIRVEGATAIDPDDLIPRLGLMRVADRQAAIDEYQLQLDLQRITGAFQRLGYFAVDVKTRVDKAKGSDAATLVFVVTEGKRATTHIEMFGLPDAIAPPKAYTAIGVAEGKPFDYDTFDASRDALQELLENSGYAHARIEATVLADRAHSTATLRYVIDPGPLVKFGLIKIDGGDGGMLDDAILARVRFEPGDVYSRKAITDTQSAIYGTGLFAVVRVTPNTDNLEQVVDVKIGVTLLDKNELSAGGGFGFDPFEYFIRGRLTWLRRRWLTPLTTSFLDVRPQYSFETSSCDHFYLPWTCNQGSGPIPLRGRASHTITQQDLFLPDMKGDVEGGFDYLTYEAFTKLAARTRFGLSYTPPAVPRLSLRVGWLYTISTFPDVFIEQPSVIVGSNQTIDFQLGKTQYLGAYTGAVVLDLRDKPIEPTFGAYLDVRVIRGTKFALGDFDYWQITPDLRLFAPLGPLVVAARARVGTITGDVPVTERYFGGGASSHRGFGQRQLAPSAYGTDMMTPIVVGGAGIVETSIELRIPLGDLKGIPLGALVFLDGGDVTMTPSELSATNQRWAIGPALRVTTPIGPVGLAVGYRLNRTGPLEPGGTGHFNFVFAVGEAY